MSLNQQTEEAPPTGKPLARGWFAAGGALWAILASSCCILPLVFVSLGISGAWIANLTALEPFRPYFATVALGFIGLGFWRIYFRPAATCAPDSYCAQPGSGLITKTVLWAALALVLAALSVAWWAPLLY